MTYDEFIQNIIDTRGQWSIPEGEYYEAHHIVPKCLGGKPKHNSVHKSKHINIIWLYPEEHFIAHKLLLEKYPSNDLIRRSFFAMSIINKDGKRYNANETDYNIAKRLLSESISGKNHQKLTLASHTPEANLKRSVSLKGKKPWNEGLTKSTDVRVANMSIKISNSTKGVKKSREHCEKVRNALIGNPKCATVKGKCKFTNGLENRYFYDGEEPKGFIKVKLINKKENKL